MRFKVSKWGFEVFLLSVVAPVYQNEKHIDDFVEMLYATLRELDIDFEVILVNDGSNDSSWEKLKKLSKSKKELTCLNLSRNYGQHRAIMAGLHRTNGDVVVVLDSDLEENPKLILELYKAYKENGSVNMIVRKKSSGKRFSYKILRLFFYKIFRLLIDFEYLSGISNYGLYPRELIQKILTVRSPYPFFPSLVSKFSTNINYIDSDESQEPSTKSTYTITSLINHGTKIITANSTRPLHLIFILGVISAIFALTYGFLVFIYVIMFGSEVSGWTTLALLISFGFSGVFLSAGIMAIYLSVLIEGSFGIQNIQITNIITGGKESAAG